MVKHSLSTASLFSISDASELPALLRMVVEAKFHAEPNDKDLWSSRYVHALAQRISDAVLLQYQAEGNMQLARSHMKWVQSLPDNDVLPAVKAKLRNDAGAQWWLRMSHDQKLAYVKGCVSPFQPQAEFLEGLICEAESKIGG
jgi:hypothetical protein